MVRKYRGRRQSASLKSLSGKQDFACRFHPKGQQKCESQVAQTGMSAFRRGLTTLYRESLRCCSSFAIPLRNRKRLLANRLDFTENQASNTAISFSARPTFFPLDHRLIKLSLLAAAADYQSLSVCSSSFDLVIRGLRWKLCKWDHAKINF